MLRSAPGGIGLISGKPGAEAELERYWTRCASLTPRVAVSRIVAADENADEVTARWSGDPARRWATMLIVQTQPAHAEFATHLQTVVDVGAALHPSARTPLGT